MNRAIALLGSRSPRPLLRRSVRRLIGGETLESACDLGARLNAEGKRVTLGLLGENVASEKEARRVAAEERRTLEEIEARGLEAALSVKLSALGLDLDEERCFDLLLALVAAAAEKGSAVLIDMERSSAVDATIRLYQRLRGEGFDNVSFALQARLERTLDDLADLAKLAPRVSICKGAYEGPTAGPVIKSGKIRELFLRALSRAADSASQIGVSTHEPELIEESRRLLEMAGRTRADYELQLLLGVAPRLENELVAAGEPVRVYVPFGEDWYPYVQRRLGRG